MDTRPFLQLWACVCCGSQLAGEPPIGAVCEPCMHEIAAGLRKPIDLWGRPLDGGDRSFALAVQPVELVEARRELLRLAQHWLTTWERSHIPEARGRLLQVLEDLALLVSDPLEQTARPATAAARRAVSPSTAAPAGAAEHPRDARPGPYWPPWRRRRA